MQFHNRPSQIPKKALVGVLVLALAFVFPVAPVDAHDGHEHGDMRPDLVIDSLTVVGVPEPGETTQVSFRIANIGAGDIVDQHISVRLRSEDYSLYYWNYVYGLGSGENVTLTANWTAPERVHVLTGSVDTYDGINETNESNNEATLEVMVGDPKADLLVWGPLLVPSEVLYEEDGADEPWRSTVREGDEMTLYAFIGNEGTAPAHDMRVQTFLDGTLYDEQVVHAEHGFRGTEYLVNWTAVLGDHTFRVVVDPLDEIDEKNETNNEGALGFTVLSTTEPVPDLAVVSVDLPEDAEVGDYVEVTATIENTGEVASSAFDTYLYVANMGAATMRLPGLEPGEQATLSVVGALPVDGYYYESSLYWGAVVDPFVQYDEETGEYTLGGEVPEDNETNNYFSGAMHVRLPNLVISDIRLPDGPFMPGDEATVQVDISNVGNASAKAAFDVQSRGQDIHVHTIYGLGVGETVTLSFPVTIWGNHYSGEVRVDAARAIGEEDEYDNSAWVEDVLDSGIHAVIEADDDEVWTGQVVTLTARFQNTGDLWHPYVYAEFYLDGEYLDSDRYSGVNDDGEIVVTIRWTPLQEGLPPQYGDRNFTVEMHPYWHDEDWSDNTATTFVTVNATPVSL